FPLPSGQLLTHGPQLIDYIIISFATAPLVGDVVDHRGLVLLPQRIGRASGSKGSAAAQLIDHGGHHPEVGVVIYSLGEYDFVALQLSHALRSTHRDRHPAVGMGWTIHHTAPGILLLIQLGASLTESGDR